MLLCFSRSNDSAGCCALALIFLFSALDRSTQRTLAWSFKFGELPILGIISCSLFDLRPSEKNHRANLFQFPRSVRPIQIYNLHFRIAFPRSSGTSGDLMLLSAGYTRDLLIFSSGKYYGLTEKPRQSCVVPWLFLQPRDLLPIGSRFRRKRIVDESAPLVSRRRHNHLR
jgi:hypothetical protein